MILCFINDVIHRMINLTIRSTSIQIKFGQIVYSERVFVSSCLNFQYVGPHFACRVPKLGM